MEYMKKEEAALKAAAKHHDYLAKAVLEYMELTKQIDDDLRRQLHESCEECLSPYNGEIDCEYMKQQGGCFLPDSVEHCSSFRAAQKEMLGLLPGYRHPAEDSLTENRIFFSEQVTDMRIKFPVWMNDDDFLKLPSELSGKIRDYIRDAEISKWQLTRGCNELRSKFIAAREAYKKMNADDDSHSRNKRVVEALGLSSGKKGKRPDINHRQAYIRYVRLVRNEGKSREEALKTVRQEFPCNSIDTAINSLYAELRKVKVWWKAKTYVWLVSGGIKSNEEAFEIVRQEFDHKNIGDVRKNLDLYEELRKDKRFGKAGLTPPNPKKIKIYWRGLILYKIT